MRELVVKLGQTAESLVQIAQTTLDRAAATLYEARASQGLRKVGLAAEISHSADAATQFKVDCSVGAGSVVHPRLRE